MVPSGQSVRLIAAPGSCPSGSIRSQASGAVPVARAPAASRRASAARLCLGRQVLPEDRVVDDMGAARARLGKPGGEPVDGVGALDPDAAGLGDGDCRRHAGLAGGLIGPDEGPEAQTVLRAGEIGRRAVDAGALDHARARQRRRRPLPVRLDTHRRGGIAPGDVAEAVGEAVPGKVQAGTGAELGGHERPAGQRGHREHPGAERGAALRLVGLRRAVEAGEDPGGMPGQRGRDGGPERRVVAVVRRVDGGEAGVELLDHQPVQRPGEAERQRRRCGRRRASRGPGRPRACPARDGRRSGCRAGR